MSLSSSCLGICSSNPAAEQLSLTLSLPILNESPRQIATEGFVFIFDQDTLALQATGKKAPGPVFVDFAGGSNAHRRQFCGGKGQMIAKAIGLKGSFRPHVLDVTAGLGQDGFVLASLGCAMTWVERSPIVYALLKDGVDRAQEASLDLRELFSNIELISQNSITYLESLNEPVDVIYLDPMFPERTSKAEVNKSMKAFHSIVGEDNDAGLLLEAALKKARYRVVVKRPRKAPCLAEQYSDLNLPKASLVFEGKSTRYDVYPLHKMP